VVHVDVQNQNIIMDSNIGGVSYFQNPNLLWSVLKKQVIECPKEIFDTIR